MSSKRSQRKKIRRIAVNTGGGDAPGLNAVIRAVVLCGQERGWEVYGIAHGYQGLLNTRGLRRLTADDVEGITNLGGSILGAASRGNPFEYPYRTKSGRQMVKDISHKVVENFHKMKLDAIVAIGGDGSLRIAYQFYQKGIPVIGVPKTIDNDLSETVITFGFDTAVSTATEAIEKLHSTAKAHDRVMVVELMGRHAGWIALNSGVSSAADVILIPEIPFDIQKVCEAIMKREEQGYHWSTVVIAEGAYPVGGTVSTEGEAEVGREVRLGGIGRAVAEEISVRTGKETRTLVLGHLQRGGNPTTFDKLLALRFGAAAIRFLEQGKFGHMVALAPPTVKAVPIRDAISKMKSVPLDSDTMITARSLGICFGD